MNDRPIYVTFWDEKVEATFERLKFGSADQKKMYKFIDRAIKDLKEDPTCGVKIQQKLWPTAFKRKYQMDNLWKYDLPGAWRLLYTIVADKVQIVNVILEWGDHKWYDHTFGY